MTSVQIDTTRHKTILFQILKDIFFDTTTSPFLGFKGGTAALLFYGLDRFSVDLDFDLLDDSKEEEIWDRVITIAKKHGTLKDTHRKRHTLFCLLSYEDTARNIKIEINRRQLGSRYEIKQYLGISMSVMVPEDMFAHKLVAMYERLGKTSRDIYDVWFFLNHRFPINSTIVEHRSQTSFNNFIDNCILRLEKMSNRQILNGVGELLSDSQKDWAKARLKSETIALLKLRKTSLN